MILRVIVGGFIFGDLVGGVVGGIAGALSAFPSTFTWRRLVVKRSMLCGGFVLCLGLLALWVATGPRFSRWRTEWRLRRLKAAVFPSERGGMTVSFRGGTVDATLEAARPYLEKLGDVTEIELIRHHITDAGLVHLERLEKLRRLDLSQTKITDAALARLRKHRNLEELWLRETQITDAGLAHVAKLAKLEYLYLSGTQITDTGLLQLATLTRLRHLRLDDTRVTGAGIRRLQRALPHAKIGPEPRVTTDKASGASEQPESPASPDEPEEDSDVLNRRRVRLGRGPVGYASR
jgi:hypothetical protein